MISQPQIVFRKTLRIQDFDGKNTLKKNMSYEDAIIYIKELEKKLSNAIKFNAGINEFCESLLRDR